MNDMNVELSKLDLWILAAYFLGILIFGMYISRRVKGGADYFLAGRSLPFWAIGLSIVGSDIGAVDFVGLVGQAFRHGLVTANMDWIGSLPALILVAFVFVPYYWRAGVYSVPEYLGRRYDQRVRAVQTIAWTLFMICNLGVTFWATAQMFEGLLGWDKTFTIVLMGFFTGVYTVSGGLMADVWTDVVQVVIMIGGASFVVVKGIWRLGGIGALHEQVLARGGTDRWTLYHSVESGSPYSWPAILVGLTLVLAPAYFGANPAIVQRCLGARNEWSAKAGVLFAALFKFLIPFIVVVPGLIGYALYPQLAEEHGDRIFSYLVRDLLPEGLRGIVVAAFVAGFMSNVDSMLNSSATLLTQDIYAGILGFPLDDKKALRIGRNITLSLIIFGALSAPLSKRFDGVYVAIQSLLAIIQGPTIALLFIGMFWRRATATAGFYAGVIGLATSILLTILHKNLENGLFATEEPFFWIAPLSCGVTAVLLVALSFLGPRKSDAELHGLVYSLREENAA